MIFLFSAGIAYQGYKDVLKKHRHSIINDMQPSGVIHCLHDELNVIDEVFVEFLNAFDKMKQNELIIQLVESTGKWVFTAFIHALDMTGQYRLAEFLDIKGISLKRISNLVDLKLHL